MMPPEDHRDKDGNGAEAKIDGLVSHAQRSAGDRHRALGVRADSEQPTVDSSHPGEHHTQFRGYFTDPYPEQNSEQR